jgi:hypothetical protein
MVTLIKGAACSSIQLTVACPASWIAIAFPLELQFYFSFLIHLQFYQRHQILFVNAVLLYLAAINAASLQTLAISAPENLSLFG